ncbi:hypothetical protein AYK26_04225 [Euryarchaeota archaeon SM23-78]|nr:MAG: hypothetical protein AYK26_04225 [Euryarchaeota archaeon SM23-78]MBW3001271.1 hypothetical protein [Candidatus Woesearchaeota archaeon]
MKAKQPKKIAIISYNVIGKGQYDNGVLKGKGVEIHISQNGHKSKWAASQGSWKEKEEARKVVAKDVVGMIPLEEMDHVYLYVGADGGEEAIKQAKDVPADKISYVLCGCNYGMKKGMIKEFGKAQAEIIKCECGGREKLEQILKQYL